MGWLMFYLSPPPQIEPGLVNVPKVLLGEEEARVAGLGV